MQLYLVCITVCFRIISEVTHLVICSFVHLLIHLTKACGASVIALCIRDREDIDDGLSSEGIHMDWIPSACFIVKGWSPKEVFIVMWLLHKVYLLIDIR